jgi:hypothetical protein
MTRMGRISADRMKSKSANIRCIRVLRVLFRRTRNNTASRLPFIKRRKEASYACNLKTLDCFDSG